MVILGFGACLLLFGLAVGYMLWQTNSITKQTSFFIEKSQPQILSSLRLIEELKGSSSALGMYLLSKETLYKESYEKSLLDLQIENENLNRLMEIEARAEDDDITLMLKSVQSDIEKLLSYKVGMLNLVVDDRKNFPAMAISASELAPLSQKILQLLSQMIVSEMEEEVSVERRQLYSNIEGLRYAWTRYFNINRAYIAFRGQNDLDNLQLLKENIISLENKIAETSDLLNLDQEDSFVQLQSAREEFFPVIDKMTEIHSSEKWRTDSYLIRTELGPLVVKISENLSGLVKQQQENAQTLKNQLLATSKKTSFLLTLLLVFGICLSMVITFLVRKQINNVISHIQESFDKLDEGDLTTRMNEKAKGELGDISRLFNHFAEGQQEVIKSNIDQSNYVSNDAEALAKTASETREQVIKQHTSTESTVSKVSDIVSMTEEISEKANEAASIADQAMSLSTDAKTVVTSNKAAIEALAKELKSAASVISNVEKNSTEIENVLVVINEIAEQTNLLALNAAIEAARAGEQGRGFAVVADEVRTLAGRTQNSTLEVSNIITKLQKGSKEAVDVMEHAGNDVDENVANANKVADTLNDILTSIENINTINKDISQTTENQKQSTAEMYDNILNIKDISVITLEGSESSALRSAGVSAIINTIKTQLGQYKVQ